MRTRSTDSPEDWLAAGPVQGVYWLPALTTRDASAIWISPPGMRLCGCGSSRSTPPCALCTSRLRAGHVPGLGNAPGRTARLRRSRSRRAAGRRGNRLHQDLQAGADGALVKAVDFEAGRNRRKSPKSSIEETLRDPGAVEIGYKDGQRWTVGLEEQPAADGQPGMTLDKNTVFLVTGAAGSIVSAITADLAAASGGTFYLLDLVPEPDPNNPDLKRFVSDKDGLKRDLFARIQARGERATPALVEKELAALERAQAAQSAIDAVRAAGGTAHYFSVNLTDADAVAKVIKQVRERSGRIDVLLHAAGMERSHFLPDKDPREFDLVFDVKSDGWFNLLHAIGDMPLGATVAFSSIAGRFGNGGQTDYSSANDLLCKITSSFRTTRPATRGIAIDWTAWGGIGMATRGSIPKMMELAGIDMLPPEAGIPLIRRELTAGGTRGEIVIGQRLGILLNEWDATGGLDTAAPEAAGAKRSPAQGPMVGKIASTGLHSGSDHRDDARPEDAAVPARSSDRRHAGAARRHGHRGVCGSGAVHASRLACRGGRRREFPGAVQVLPERAAHGDDRSGDSIRKAKAVVADCRLIGRRTLPNQTEPQVTTHFTARVRLTKQPPEAVDRAGAGSTSRNPSSKPPTSIASTSTGPLTRCWSGRGGMETDGRADGQRLACQSSSARTADARGAAADRALLPDRRALGDGHPRPDGSAAAR